MSSVGKIIALVGKRRCGKDTLANYLATKHGYTNVKVAAALKKTCMYLFNLSHDEIEGDEKDSVHPTWGTEPRRLMQFIGTEVMQFHIESILPGQKRCFWIKRLCQDIVALPDDQQSRIVISDVRFPHEVDYLRQQFSSSLLVVSIERKTERTSLDLHISEQEYNHIVPDIVIHNNATKEDMYKIVDQLLQS